MGENHFAAIPSALYGGVLFMAAIAYYILQCLIIAEEGGDQSKLGRAIGVDWKGKLSPVLIGVGIAASFFVTWVAACLYASVALLWLIPDKRIEEVVEESKPSHPN